MVKTLLLPLLLMVFLLLLLLLLRQGADTLSDEDGFLVPSPTLVRKIGFQAMITGFHADWSVSHIVCAQFPVQNDSARDRTRELSHTKRA